ncbi:DUF1524 domain-containing protein [Streptomyces sp. NPDC048172]|uniref:GmrSD restriction endonuclease domain-containing protein n=1 Tax=Streptomyces sp. NPDC048172 TaxID=3365505 RepID=UPI00371D8639
MRGPGSGSLTVTVTVMVAALLGSTGATSAAPGAPAAPGDSRTVSLSRAVASLPVAGEKPRGFAREKFAHWSDPDQDGCSTRAEVLIEEATTPPAVDGRCTVTGGKWHSYYDKKDHTGAHALAVDHLVPLGEAWESGAGSWKPEEREAYANDVDDPRTLAAVTAAEHRAKGDTSDPARWEPSDDGADCRYVAEWAAVKHRWGLSADKKERAALKNMAAECPPENVTVTKAR